MAVKPKLKLSEADVTQQVCDFMGYEGWRGVRNNVGIATNLATGQQVAFNERGIPDWQFIRYDDKPRRGPAEFRKGARDSDPKINADFWRSRSCLMWIEMKAPGEKPKPHQTEWHEAERLRGGLVKVVDHFESFRDWYRDTFSRKS